MVKTRIRLGVRARTYNRISSFEGRLARSECVRRGKTSVSNAEDRLEMRVVSPELVLVDPELAAWCRLRLCEEAAAAEARRRESARPLSHTRPAPPPPLQPARRGTSWPRLLARESVAALAAVLVLGVSGAASRPAPFAAGVAGITTPEVYSWPRPAHARRPNVRTGAPSFHADFSGRKIVFRASRAWTPRYASVRPTALSLFRAMPS